METQTESDATTWTLEESTPRLTPAAGNPLPFLNRKLKSSLRLNYEAQVKVIQNQVGDLEKIRMNLGLSRRKLAQLLLVDPSAWTRWLKEDSAPPHIYRSLQWFMILQEKVPGLTANYFLGPNTEFSPMALKQHVRDQIRQHLNTEWNDKPVKINEDETDYRADMVSKIQRLESELEQNRKLTLWSVGTSIVLFVGFILFYFYTR